MQDQKIENLLNMALSLSPFEREMSYDLNTGYNSVDNTWEVVVRYNRDLDTLVEMGIPVTFLYGGYAILELPQSMINLVASMTEIEYMEKPKNLSFASTDAKSVSCFGAIQKKTSVKEYIDGEMKSVVEFSGLTLSVCFILTYTVLAIFIIHSFDLFWYFEVQKSGFSVKSSVFSIVSYVMME